MKASQRIWKKKMKMTDERSKQITEIMSGIRIIKFMSWENRFMDKVRVTRDKEIKLQIKNQMLSALLSAVYSSLPILMIVIVLGKIAMLSRFACCPSRLSPKASLFQDCTASTAASSRRPSSSLPCRLWTWCAGRSSRSRRRSMPFLWTARRPLIVFQSSW